MKLFKKITAIAAGLCLLWSAGSAAYADAPSDPRFDGKTWEQVVDDFVSENGIESIRTSMGYCNLVTGEEHYYNADKLMIHASLYKVPLNMYFNDLVADGTISWDTPIGFFNNSYEYLMEETIINSSNEMAGELMSYMGGYQALRTLICPYMGVDAATADPDYIKNDYFSARQMICCLRQLYDGGDRYARIIECMKQAEPVNYFKYNTQEFEVAHKYGFDSVEYHEYLNDCAIVYTDEPIAIVMFSDTLPGGYDTMSNFCTLMSDYAQYTTALLASQAAQEKVEANQAQREALAAATPQPLVVESSSFSLGFGGIIAAVLTLLAAVLALFMLAKARESGALKLMWAVVAILLAVLALLLCIIGYSAGTLYYKTEGDPQQTVTTLMDALCVGDYDTVYGCILNCDGMGLESTPSSRAGELAYEALKNSYSYELYGECATDKLTAYQQLRFDYLDMTAFESDVQDATPESLKKLVQSTPRNKVYDENDAYLPEITESAYLNAVESVLDNAEAYYTTTWLTLELQYSDGRWQVVSQPSLLRAILGGVAY